MKYTEVYLCHKCGWIWEHESFEDAEFEELG